MKALELKTKSKEELEELLKEKRRDIDSLKFSLYQGKTKNVKELGAARKDIARIMGILGEKK